MKFGLLSFLVAGCLLVSCSLIPKRVELGQDKVEKVPVAKARENEHLRQGAQRAAEKSQETLYHAIDEKSSVAVVDPARDTVALTGVVSDSLGPPTSSSALLAPELAALIRKDIAKLNDRLSDFQRANDRNAGKKIEGTGWLSIPYIVWLGGAVFLGFATLVVFGVLWTAFKMYATTNPPVALGLKAVQLGGRAAASLASEVIQGGEAFQSRLQKITTPLNPTEVNDLFVSSQKESQSPETQDVVHELTNP